MTPQIPVIWNPTSGIGRAKRSRPKLEAAAAAAGIGLEWLATQRPGHATELAREAASRDCPLVLAFGGDGTYNEVARGLVGTQTSLGILPGGTTSVLAYELGLSQDVEAALPALLEGEDRRVAVGRTDRGQIFLLMLSAGPDAVILDRLPTPLKRLAGKTGITVQAVREFVRGNLPCIRASLDGRNDLECGWVIAGNGRCYGGPFVGAPGASIFSENLVVVVQYGVGRGKAVPFFFGIPSGRHVKREDVVVKQARKLRLDAVGEDRVPYQLDGDPAGSLPVEATIEPEALLMRVPASQSRPANSSVEM